MSQARKAETGAADPIIQQLADNDPQPWWKKKNLRYLYFMLVPTCIGVELTSGFDSQAINALQIVPAWKSYFSDLPNDEFSGELKGIIAAAYSLGSILCLPFIGIISDRLGRRWSIFLGSAVMVVGGLIQGFSVNVPMYIIARILLGAGIPLAIVAGSSMCAELAYPKERAYLTCFFNVSFYVGQVLAAGICFGTNNIDGDNAWRIPSWLQMAPSLMQMGFIFLIPESPRWLVQKDRADEARQILVQYHGEGDENSEFVKAEFAHITTTIQLEMERSSVSYLDLFRTPGMRRRSLISAMLGLFNQWSGNTLISYYLSDLLDMIGRSDSVFQQQINVAISCWSLVCGVVISLTMVRMKRVTAAYICTIGMLAVYAAWTGAMQQSMEAMNNHTVNKAANGAVIFLIFAYKPAYQIFFNSLTYTYLTEIWPLAERARGISWFQLWSRIAGFVTTFVNPIGLRTIEWKYFLTYVAVLVFEVVSVYFFFPETSNRTLEELAFLFEDKELAERANESAMNAMDKSKATVIDEIRPNKQPPA